MDTKNWIGIVLAFVVTFLLMSGGADRATGGLARAVFGGGPGERDLYMKLPLDLPRFHWKFDSQAAVLAGRLEVEIRGHDGRDTTLVVFEDGAMSDGWRAIETDRGEGELYFGFVSDVRVPTHPKDSVIVRLDVPQDLAGQGRWYTASLPAGRYEAVSSYSVMSGHPTLGSLLPWSGDDDATAYIGCWRELWPLRVTERQGWAGTPEDAAERYGRTLSFLDRVTGGERGTDGRRCVGGGAR